MYCKLMIISPPPPLYTSLSLKSEEDIYSNIELVTTICPRRDAHTYTWMLMTAMSCKYSIASHLLWKISNICADTKSSGITMSVLTGNNP